jgi:hypothetical protein
LSAQIFLHPALLVRHAAEIAQSQRGMVEYDACGRPFVRGADPLTQQGGRPLAEVPAEPLAQPGRFEWLLRVIRALGRPAMGQGEGRFRGTR